MSYLNKIPYLEISDFDSKGNIKEERLVKKNLPVLIMIQANFCGWCNKSKPDFQKLADSINSNPQKKVILATIQGDGEEKGEQELAQILDVIDKSGFNGYPTYVLYTPASGKLSYKKTHTGGREAKDLADFIEENVEKNV